MNKGFENWLKQQTYTLTDGGFPYEWEELIFYTMQNQKYGYIFRREFTWGLWRKCGSMSTRMSASWMDIDPPLSLIFKKIKI